MPLPLLGLIPLAMNLASEYLPGMVSKIAGDKTGKVAEQVLDTVASVTGVRVQDGAGVDAVKQAMAAAPEKALALQQRLAELENELTAMFLGDRQSARSRDVEMTKAGQHNIRADVMVVGAFVALIVISCFLITAENIDKGVMGFLTTIGGMLMKSISTAFDFEFGSSRSSGTKTQAMSEMFAKMGGANRER